MTRNELFRHLADAGVAKAVAHFSGGNDSGGVEDIYFLDDTGTRVEKPGLLHDHVYGEDYDKYYQPRANSFEWTLKYDAPLGLHLRDALEKPVYDRYGSFAGEFYVDGEVIFDVAAKTVKMEADQSVSDYEHYSFDV